jgi:hypothetical protein
LSNWLNSGKKEFCEVLRSNAESVMSEAEFERVLDAVNAAIAPIPQPDFIASRMTSGRMPKAANDNGLSWPLVPFPDGWHASC